MKLANKVAVITGASRGIGKAIALLFAKEGAKIVVNYAQSEIKANDVVTEIKKLGSDAITVKCDVSQEKEVSEMVQQAIKKFGKIDILVNNAGIVFDVPLFEKTVKQWKRTLEVNLIGQFLCAKHASKHMLKQKEGVIINIASSNGIYQGSPDSADYDTSKAGVINLTKIFAQKLAPNIRVNCIAPGWVNTDLNANLPKDIIEEETKQIFMKRWAKPEEIAKVALFLATDDSSFMTGSTIVADGGHN